jgi:hypothetical protein
MNISILTNDKEVFIQENEDEDDKRLIALSIRFYIENISNCED